jgi:hypothetical protein
MSTTTIECAHSKAALKNFEDADLDTALDAWSRLKKVELVAEQMPLLLHLNVEHGRFAS